ncbi:DUF1569 domain-containing protein [Cytophaga aurantiaca]|uniref:DUF1569 domain-containing protein n=1 Tax=Cytophaga aurantiaca TaxID=29530 RepID=UPI000373B61F|nr:DUF1569 domain-containing protein [Cytophaga aurantiaca]
MKSTLDKTTREELITRIQLLTENSSAQWGKMNVYQMLKHCIQWEEMFLEKKQYKQSFIGRFFGKFALKDMLKDAPIKPNLPTVPSFKTTGTGDVAAAKTEWISLLEEYTLKQHAGFVHPFFGRITAEQAGIMDYKHIDHHLKQFNC